MSRVDFEITVGLGGRHREVSVPELAAALGLDLPRLRAALLGLLHEEGMSVSPACPQEEGDYRGRSLLKLQERNGFSRIDSEPFVPFREGGGPGEETADALSSPERLADYLADALRDERSLAFYKLVANAVPREVVRDALMRALDVPRHEVRKNRAAIFTALVRRHLPGSS